MSTLVGLKKHGRQCMTCSAKFSMTLHTEILSTKSSDFLKKNHKSFNSVLLVIISKRGHHYFQCTDLHVHSKMTVSFLCVCCFLYRKLLFALFV